ncbi:MAG: right-handed parallel beta-helix repeat-containing protein [Kineosporiaceae bacterium]
MTSSSVPTGAGAVGVHAFAGESSQGPRLMKIDNVLVVPPSTGGTTTPDPVPGDSTPPSAATPDSSGLTVPSGAKFVATWGNDANDGSQERPWKTVTKAVKTVPSGGTVVLRSGSYHEDVEVPIYKPLRIQAYPDEQVWFDGSSVVTSWTRSGNVWSTPWTTAFDHSDPTHALVDTRNYPLAAYPEQVWVGGVALTQVGSASAVKAGTFYVDSSAKKILMGTDPSSGEVRLATLSDALFVNYGKGSQILGIGFRRFATSISRMGAVKLYADEGVVRGCAFVDNAFAGLSLRGTRITVSDSGFAGNGQLGVQADRSDNLVLSELFVQRNNVQGFRVDQAAGGVKITHSRTVTIRNSLITKNIGSGLWIDQSSKGAVVVGNRLTENTRHGMVFEISAGLVFAGNRAERNGDAGINVLESGTVKIFNNVFISNYKGINVLDGDRLATRNLSAPELDDRYPLPDPLVTWEVRDVAVQGNVVSADGAERFLIGYDDARKANSARSRNVAANYNAYHRTSSGASTYFAAWGDWPTKMLAASTLSQFRSLAGQESAGTAADANSNPYIGSDGVGTSVSPWSPGLPSDVASAVGVSTGASLRAGLPRALP